MTKPLFLSINRSIIKFKQWIQNEMFKMIYILGMFSKKTMSNFREQTWQTCFAPSWKQIFRENEVGDLHLFDSSRWLMIGADVIWLPLCISIPSSSDTHGICSRTKRLSPKTQILTLGYATTFKTQPQLWTACQSQDPGMKLAEIPGLSETTTLHVPHVWRT